MGHRKERVMLPKWEPGDLHRLHPDLGCFVLCEMGINQAAFLTGRVSHTVGES